MPSLALTQDLNQSFRLEATLGFALRQASQLHAMHLQRLLPDGLTAPQWAVLAKLYELGSCSQNELGRQVLMDAATVKGVVDRLRRRDLVVAEADPVDRRRIILSLTDAGYEMATDMISTIDAAETDVMRNLMPDERTQLADLLAKMCS